MLEYLYSIYLYVKILQLTIIFSYSYFSVDYLFVLSGCQITGSSAIWSKVCGQRLAMSLCTK